MNKMEEKNDVMSYLLQGCNLARDLESKLPNLVSNYPQIVAQRCEEIIGAFVVARNHLDHDGQPSEPEVAAMVAKTLEMAATGYARQEEEGNKGKKVAHGSLVMATDPSSGPAVEGGGSSSSAHHRSPRRTSSRKEEQETNKRRVTVRMAAPQIGNLELPPDDGYTWRKYGQKEILRAKYPRSYYRCTYQKLYNCPAKKQVQRLDDDPYTFEILYRGEHTCDKSSTAPSMPPVPPPHQATVQDILSPHMPIATVHSPLNRWLFLDFPRPLSEGASTGLEQTMLSLSRSSITPEMNHAPGSASAVGSHLDGLDIADFLNQTVADLVADVINSEGNVSVSNGMEVLFPAASDSKWEAEGRKD